MRQHRAIHETPEHRKAARMMVDFSDGVAGKTANDLERAVKLAPGGEVTVKIKCQFDPEIKTAKLEKLT